jgi:transcriptional antiterminator NusG
MAKEWFVIHTYSGHENKVKFSLEKKDESIKSELIKKAQEKESAGLSEEANTLNELAKENIFEVRIPTMEEKKSKDGKQRVVTKKLMPGYVLVKMEMNDENWSIVRNVKGVTNFVGASASSGLKKPKPLTKDEVNSLLSRQDDVKGKEKPHFGIEFSVGEHITVIEGPFNGFSGVVEEVHPEKGRLRVKVEIFGRGTPVELDFMQVGKI